MRYIIYALVDPRSGRWRYVGKSTSGLRRPRRHESKATIETTYKANWIRSLQAAGLAYGVEVLEAFDSPEPLAEAEREWIARAREAGVPLTNLTDGGEGAVGRKHTPEARAKMATASRSRGPASPETRKRLSTAHQKRWTAARRARAADAARGRSPSIEARAKMAAAARGRKHTVEARSKMVENWKIRREQQSSLRGPVLLLDDVGHRLLQLVQVPQGQA